MAPVDLELADPVDQADPAAPVTAVELVESDTYEPETSLNVLRLFNKRPYELLRELLSVATAPASLECKW